MSFPPLPLFSTRPFSVASLCLSFCLLFQGCKPLPPSSDRARELSDADSGGFAPSSVPTPTWDSTSEILGEGALKRARSLADIANFASALRIYEELYLSSPQGPIRDEAFLQKLINLLKLGRSRLLLEESAKYLESSGKSISEAPPRLALVVAYAYKHRGDMDQLFAWFALAVKNSKVLEVSQTKGLFFHKVRDLLEGLVGSLSEDDFLTYSSRWLSNPSLGKVFFKEKVRRFRGGKPLPPDTMNWYSQDFYKGFAHIPHRRASNSSGAPSGSFKLGVLLPLSEKYSEYGERVKRGIELAVADYGDTSPVKLLFADSTGGKLASVEAYRGLARKGVSFVLGPLLAKTSEDLALAYSDVKLPFLSFSKKEGIADFGLGIYRLGATVKDQVSELVSYAISHLGKRRFGILYPDTDSGRSFLEHFLDLVESYGATVVARSSYFTGDPQSVREALSELSYNPPELLFVPDTLEGAFPILSLLGDSKEDYLKLRELRLLGPALWYDMHSIRGYATVLHRAVFVTPFFEESERRDLLNFVSKYRKRYGETPGLLAAQAYDAARIVLDNLCCSASSHGDVIRKMAASGDFEGVTGRISISPNGDLVRRMSVLGVNRGRVEELLFGGRSVVREDGIIREDSVIRERDAAEGRGVVGAYSPAPPSNLPAASKSSSAPL